MTLKDLRTMPIQSVIDNMDIVDLKIHSDSKGLINSIEIKYADPAEVDNSKSSEVAFEIYT